MAPVIELEGVWKSYDAPGGGAVQVLAGLDLRVEAGQAVAVFGPSGAGKSTLLNLVGCLDTPDRGTVRLGEADVAGLDEEARADLRALEVGFVFQEHHLLPQLSALDNAVLPSLARAARRAGRERIAPDRCRELLRRVGLEGRFGHYPAQLSMGECQRVAAVRALANRPRVLLADEPTGALDAATAAGLVELLLELQRQEGFTLIMVTHAEELGRRLGTCYRLRRARLEPA